MDEGGDVRNNIHSHGVCSSDICDGGKVGCEDRRKWKKVTNVLRELEDGCNIRIGKLGQMMDVIDVGNTLVWLLKEEVERNKEI